MMISRPAAICARLCALLLLLVSLTLMLGGAYLLWLGGSPYYVIAGFATAASVIGIGRLRPWGARLYTALLLFTMP